MTALDIQGDLLDLIARDPIHDRDITEITGAIRADATGHGGEVDPNRVRAALTGPHGIRVQPTLIGTVFSGLVRSKNLTQIGWTENTDLTSRNRGKPLRRYRWTGDR
jgi:hypothetical protein